MAANHDSDDASGNTCKDLTVTTSCFWCRAKTYFTSSAEPICWQQNFNNNNNNNHVNRYCYKQTKNA